MLCFKSRSQHTQQNFDGSYTGCQLGSVLSTKLLRLLTRRSILVYRSTYTIFFTTTIKQELCVHQPPTSCSVLHSSVRSLTGRFRLQHLPSGTLCRHQPDPLTLGLLVLLDLDLKPICLRQHTLPRTVQRYRSASDSRATTRYRNLYWLWHWHWLPDIPLGAITCKDQLLLANPRDALHHGKRQNLKTVTWPLPRSFRGW